MTDADRAFEEWVRSGRYSTGGIRGALMRAAWHAAIAWATARERERGWRPAETAPHDGFFLAWSPDFPELVMTWKADIFHSARLPGTPRHLSANHFTHWMPIPKPPTPADDSKAPGNDAKPITLTYRNHRGEVSERTITPKRVWYGATAWHPEPQWLLTAFDHDKGADRDFALKELGDAVPARPEPPADLVERAYAVLKPWLESEWKPSVEGMEMEEARLIADFAAEYAAEQAGETNAERINKTSITRYWKDRAEAAEQALAEWKAQADKLNDYVSTRVPADEMVGAVAGAIAHEREACAKVVDAYRNEWDATPGYGFKQPSRTASPPPYVHAREKPMSHDQIGMDPARHAGERASEAMMDALRLCESPSQASMVAFQVLGVVAAQAAGILSKTYGVEIAGKDAVSMLEMLTEIMREVSTDHPQPSIRAPKGG